MPSLFACVLQHTLLTFLPRVKGGRGDLSSGVGWATLLCPSHIGVPSGRPALSHARAKTVCDAIERCLEFFSVAPSSWRLLRVKRLESSSRFFQGCSRVMTQHVDLVRRFSALPDRFGLGQ